MSKEKKKFVFHLPKLLKFTKGKNYLLLVAFVLSLLSTLFQVVGPELLRKITDAISVALPKVSGENAGVLDLAYVFHLSHLLLWIYLISFGLRYIQSYIFSYLIQKNAYELRKNISQKIHRLPFSYFDGASTGDLLSRITNDVESVSIHLNQMASSFMGSVALLLCVVLMMLWSHFGLALLTIASSLLGVLGMGVFMLSAQKYYQERQKVLGKLNGYIEEAYTGHELIQAYNASQKSKEAFEKLNQELYVNDWKTWFFSCVMMPMMMFIENFSYVVVSVVGVMLVFSGKISFGVLVAFMMYVRLFNQPLSTFAQSVSSIQSANAGTERIFSFLEEKEMQDEQEKKAAFKKKPLLSLDKVQGEVVFQNLSFAYQEGKPVIKNFSAKIKSGQKVAIVGPTGAGKTTLVNLLMRFYELSCGKILIDGVDIQDVPREEVQKCFGMVLQDAWIFEGSIYENIVYNKENVPLEKVIQVCKTLGIHHFIKTLPLGYHTKLDEKSSFSEGQKQLLTLARVMVQEAPLLILDEATSSVDTRTESLVQKAMDEVAKGKTSFVIAHRLSTIKNADIILVLKEGDIVEQGTHTELLQKDGFYAELYKSQFAV